MTLDPDNAATISEDSELQSLERTETFKLWKAMASYYYSRLVVGTGHRLTTGIKHPSAGN